MGSEGHGIEVADDQSGGQWRSGRRPAVESKIGSGRTLAVTTLAQDEQVAGVADGGEDGQHRAEHGILAVGLGIEHAADEDHAGEGDRDGDGLGEARDARAR